MPIIGQPCLGSLSMSPASGDGDGHAVSWYFQAFVLWRLSLAVCCALLRVRAAVAESHPLSQNRGDCGLFSTDDLATLTLFLLVLFNPAVSQDVHPTPGVPALTSRAGTSLSFVFLMPPAASHPRACSRSSRSQSGSSEHTGDPRLHEIFGGARSRPQFAVSRVQVRGPPAPRYRWLPLPGARTRWLPPPSVYLPISVHGFTAPPFVPQYSSLEMFMCRDPDVSSCVSG